MAYQQPQAAERKQAVERKVQVLLRHSEGPEHCNGVESLALSPDGGTLFTGSRDSTIKRWSTAATNSGTAPVCTGSLEGHTDWVNDVALCGRDVLVSCSNDRTVRVWQADGEGILLSTLDHHSDYVTCLAAAQQLVASGGLRGELFLTDMATGKRAQLRPRRPAPSSASPALSPMPSDGSYSSKGLGVGGLPQAAATGAAAAEDGSAAPVAKNKASIYAVALNTAGTVVAAGSSDDMVRLWDARSGEKIGKLRGHTDNVRSLLLHADGSLLLSGAADGTVKLWDMCMQRCVQTYHMHSGSVWALQASEDWSVVYSGGRDKCVFRTHLGSRTAELLAHEQQPVRRLALDQQHNTLWVATTSPCVSKWRLPSKGPAAATSAPGPSFPAAPRRPSASVARGAREMDAAQTREAVLLEPCCSTPGIPPICGFRVLNDRRHILASNSEGEVSLWDVLSGGPTQHFGKVDLEQQARALFEPCSVPAWFACDIRLGQLALTLEAPSCFSAEEYAQSLGHEDMAEDARLSLGKLVLEGVFGKWQFEMTKGADAAAAGAAPAPAAVPNSAKAQGKAEAGVRAQLAPYEALYPGYWQGVQPAVMCSTSTGVPWRLPVRALTAAAAPEPDVVPPWVGDALVRHLGCAPKDANKAAFILLPAEGSHLPQLPQNRLTAPRILQAYKVAAYCRNKIAEQGLQLEYQHVPLPRPGQSQQQPPPPALNAEQGQLPLILELTCNDMAVPSDMSLASVKKFIWRRSDDLTFSFRILDPLNPAPLPVLQ